MIIFNFVNDNVSENPFLMSKNKRYDLNIEYIYFIHIDKMNKTKYPKYSFL